MFGINTFFGTVLKSIINLIFADKRGLAFDVHTQVKQTFNNSFAQCFTFKKNKNKKNDTTARQDTDFN